MGDRPVALVTGGTNGIGLAVAAKLRDRGDHVAVIGIAEAEAKVSREALGPDAVVEVGDVSAPDVCASVVQSVVERWGRLDSLCAAAAVRPVGTITETDPAAWDRAFAVNVRGVYLACRAALEVMVPLGGGAIVNVGSPSGHGGEGHAAYAATKGAILALSSSMALDHRRDHVRVNVVVPGSTRTAMNAGRDPAIEAAIADLNSVTGELNDPDDVAGAVAFLLSEEARTITGAVLHVGAFAGEPVRSVRRVQEDRT